MPQLSSNSGISKYEEDKKLMLSRLQELFDTKYLDKKIGFIDSKIPLHIKANDIQSMKIREFFSLLAVCHTVLVEKSDDSNPNSILYRAQSPDEAALVSAAKNVGFACLNRTDNKVEVDIMGIPRTYTILNILEFNSDRKRMSVVVKRPEGDIILLCKGADSVIYERLDNSVSKDIIDQTSIHLGNFANEGLRTLCLAYRAVSQEEYDTWSVLYRKAQSALVDREKECDTISDLIENNLTLMGATAIEDKLQDGVPESIALLAQAGIKLWVLTVRIFLIIGR
jgi:phospholipid-translocating ATPase